MTKELSQQFNRVFVTGDIHGDMNDLAGRVMYIGDTTKDDLLILLGDIGFFYSVYYDKLQKDLERQKLAADLPITLLCIQGNHEQPFAEMAADKIKLLGGDGYESNDIYFAANGTVFDINGKKSLIVGGAYSVDKFWRLERGNAWWENEELTDAELDGIYKTVKGQKFDFVITHTCPYNFLPREVFLPGIDQSHIKNRTEHALQKIHDSISFDRWYCGHFHTDKLDGKIEFFYRSVKQII
ncbi:MAG: metallophosphoesterase [Firmicutes bacterium]|nr:metallophosphoesterase [Bacillota bacterium]